MTPTLMTFMDNAPLLLAPSTLEVLHDTDDTKEERASCSTPQPARAAAAVDGMDDSLESPCRRAFVRAIAGAKNASALVASKRPSATVPATAMAVFGSKMNNRSSHSSRIRQRGLFEKAECRPRTW